MFQSILRIQETVRLNQPRTARHFQILQTRTLSQHSPYHCDSHEVHLRVSYLRRWQRFRQSGLICGFQEAVQFWQTFLRAQVWCTPEPSWRVVHRRLLYCRE